MRVIQEIIADMYLGNIRDDQAIDALKEKLTPEDMAYFIVDAFNRGWITRYNLGIDDEGRLL